MDLSQRTTTIAGLAMILLAIGLAIFVATSAGTSDKSPFEKDEVAQFLTDVHDDEGLVIAQGAIGIINDGFLSIIVAATIYVLFRDRSPLLATVALAGFVANAAVSLLVDGSGILMTIIAKDFVEGGPGNIAAGDPAVLEVGRYVGMVTFAFTNVAFTTLGVALLALGFLIAGAPQGLINPPKWIGWVAIVAGAASELAWLVVLVDAGFIFFIISLLASFILLLSLGIWLLRHGDLQPAPMKA